jgi:hypothetical protein
MSVLVPTSFGTRNWPIRWVPPTAWARRGQAAGSWRRRGDSSGTWIESHRAGGDNRRPRGQRPHVGAHREIPAGHANRVQLSAVHPEVRDPRRPQRTRHTSRHPRQHRHSAASANRHRIPAGWKSDAGGWQTAGASAVSQSGPWYFSAVREPAGPTGPLSDQAVGEQQDRHPGNGSVVLAALGWPSAPPSPAGTGMAVRLFAPARGERRLGC